MDDPVPRAEDPAPVPLRRLSDAEDAIHATAQQAIRNRDGLLSERERVDRLERRQLELEQAQRDAVRAALLLDRAADAQAAAAASGDFPVLAPRHAAPKRERPPWLRVIKGGLAAFAPLALVLRSHARHTAAGVLTAAAIGTGATVAVELPGPGGMPKAPAAVVPSWHHGHHPGTATPAPRPSPGQRPRARQDPRAGRHQGSATAAHSTGHSPAPVPASSTIPTGTPAPPPLPVPTVTPVPTPTVPQPTCDPDGDDCDGIPVHLPGLASLTSSVRNPGPRLVAGSTVIVKHAATRAR